MGCCQAVSMPSEGQQALSRAGACAIDKSLEQCAVAVVHIALQNTQFHSQKEQDDKWLMNFVAVFFRYNADSEKKHLMDVN